MPVCNQCEDTFTRVGNNGVCKNCRDSIENDNGNLIPGITNEEFDNLPDLPNNWLDEPIHNLKGGHILKILLLGNNAFTARIDEIEKASKKIGKELEATKKSLALATKDITELKTKVASLTNTLVETKKERDELKTTGVNNLKYLINLDRNVRRSNVILLGVPEDHNLVIGENEAEEEKEKIDVLLDHIKVKNKVEILSHFRLGKKHERLGEDPKRPIKIVLKNSEMATLITSNARLLKPLGKKIFFKPDKSAKEREEFQRLLKKKNEKMISHPTEEGAPCRVLLKQGVLTVDGIEVDRYKTPQTIF